MWQLCRTLKVLSTSTKDWSTVVSITVTLCGHSLHQWPGPHLISCEQHVPSGRQGGRQAAESCERTEDLHMQVDKRMEGVSSQHSQSSMNTAAPLGKRTDTTLSTGNTSMQLWPTRVMYCTPTPQNIQPSPPHEKTKAAGRAVVGCWAVLKCHYTALQDCAALLTPDKARLLRYKHHFPPQAEWVCESISSTWLTVIPDGAHLFQQTGDSSTWQGAKSSLRAHAASESAGLFYNCSVLTAWAHLLVCQYHPRVESEVILLSKATVQLSHFEWSMTCTTFSVEIVSKYNKLVLFWFSGQIERQLLLIKPSMAAGLQRIEERRGVVKYCEMRIDMV